MTGDKHQDAKSRVMSSHTNLDNGDRRSHQRETAVGVSLYRIVSVVCEMFGVCFAKQCELYQHVSQQISEHVLQ